MEGQSAEGIYASTAGSQFCHDQTEDQGLTLYPVSQSFPCSLLSQTLLAQDVAPSNAALGGVEHVACQSMGCSDLGGDADDRRDAVDGRPRKRPWLLEEEFRDSLEKSIGGFVLEKTDGLAEGRMNSDKLIDDGVESQLERITTDANSLEAASLLRNMDCLKRLEFAPTAQVDSVAGFELDVRESDRVQGVKDGVSEDVWVGACSASDLSILGDIEAQTWQAIWPIEDTLTRDATCAFAKTDNHQTANTQSGTTNLMASSPSPATIAGPAYSPFHTFSVAATTTTKADLVRPTSAARDQLSGFSTKRRASFAPAAFPARILTSTPNCTSTCSSNPRNGGLALESPRDSSSRTIGTIPTAKMPASQSSNRSAGQHVLPSSICPSLLSIPTTVSRDPTSSSDLRSFASALGHSGYPGLDIVPLNNSVLCSQKLGGHSREPNNGPVTPYPLPRGQQQMLNTAPKGAFPTLPPTPPSSCRLASSLIDSPSPLSSTATRTPVSTPKPHPSSPSSDPSIPCHNQELLPHPLPPYLPTAMYKKLFNAFTRNLGELRWYKLTNYTLGQRASNLEKQIEGEKEKSRDYRAERDKYRTACTEWVGIVPSTGKSMVGMVRSELATKAKELASAIKDKDNAIGALITEANRNKELEAQLEASDKEIEQLKLALAQTNNRTADDAQGSTSGGSINRPTGIASTQNRLAGKGIIPPGGRLTLPGSGQCATTTHSPSANSSRPTGVASTHGRLILPGSSGLVLPNDGQSTTAHPPANQKCLTGKGDILMGGRLFLPGSSQSATTMRSPATQKCLPGKGSVPSGGRLVLPDSSQSTTTAPPASAPSHTALPSSTRPTAKPRHRVAKSRCATTPEQAAVPITKNRRQKRVQITDQPDPPIRQSSPTEAIDLTTPPSSPFKPLKRKREYTWLPSNKIPKPAPYPSARRLSREAAEAERTYTVDDDEPPAAVPGGGDEGRADSHAELDRGMMECGGQKEVEQQGKGQEDWAGFEAELEREMMECDGGQGEAERWDKGKDWAEFEKELEREIMECDSVEYGVGQREKSVDSLFGDPLDSEL